jgi:cutinase
MLFVPAVSSASTGDLPFAQGGSCVDVQVVFARGTGEPPGAGRVGQAFVDSLRSLANGKSVVVYAVDYPASYEFSVPSMAQMTPALHKHDRVVPAD